jgi:hypothetical protein
MKKIIIFNKIVTFSILSIFLAALPLKSRASDWGIADPDCDSASKSLSGLIEAIKKNSLSPKEIKSIPEELKANISGYTGDPEKCLMVTTDFVKVLSIDALAEFKDQRYKSIFEKALFSTSEYQPGDLRQHAAMALAKIKSQDSLKMLLKASREKTTYMVGYKEAMDEDTKYTIGQLLLVERRDLRQDPYSFPILEAIRALATKNDFVQIKSAINDEHELYIQGRSNWSNSVTEDMLRIAASLDPDQGFELVQTYRDLPAMARLRVFAFIQNSKIIDPLVEIIHSSLKIDSSDIPQEAKLAFLMLSRIKGAAAKAKIKELAGSADSQVNFMANVYLTHAKKTAPAKIIQSQMPLVPDRLKFEGLKVLGELGDRNVIPVIKGVYSQDNLKLKVFAIDALSKLKVTDFVSDAKKLKDKITEKEEDLAKLNLKGSLDDAIRLMEKTKPAYKN